MDPWYAGVIAAMVGGVALPAVGVVRALFSGRKVLDDLERRRARAKELGKQKDAAMNAYRASTEDPTDEAMSAISIEYNARMEAEGIVAPTYENAMRFHEGEIDYLAREFISANVLNAATAGMGLLLGLAGGIVSLFPPL